MLSVKGLKKKVKYYMVKRKLGTLTSMVQLVACHPTKQKVMGLIPSQGTCLGCGLGHQLGHI